MKFGGSVWLNCLIMQYFDAIGHFFLGVLVEYSMNFWRFVFLSTCCSIKGLLDLNELVLVLRPSLFA